MYHYTRQEKGIAVPCITRIGGNIGKWAAIISLAVLIAGILYGISNPSLKALEQNKDLEKVTRLSNSWQMIAIYMNNTSVMILLYALSVAIIPGLIILFNNGYIIGSVAAIGSKNVGGLAVLLLLAPHGILELYAFIYASAAAISLPFNLLRRRRNSAREILTSQLYGLLYAAIILFIAAFIEAFITARIASLVTG